MKFIRLTQDDYYYGIFETSKFDPYTSKGVDVYDDMLHATLTKIFRERDLTNGQIKELLCCTDLRRKDCIINLIGKQEPRLRMHYADPPIGGLEHLSILWMAILCHYKNSIKLLVRSGANVNDTFGVDRICLNDNSTVLHAMVLLYPSSEHEPLIRLVMEHGARLNAQDSLGDTVLHLAVRQNRVELARMFLDNKANVYIKNRSGDTPFALIADKNLKNPMVQLIIKALALQKFTTPMIEFEEESLLKWYPELWYYYQDCIERVEKTIFQRFDENYTFFQLLTQCPCSFAALMQRERDIWDFEKNFHMRDLNQFSMYAEDLLRAFESARSHCRWILDMEDAMNQIFRHLLHYELMREGVRYFCKCYCERVSHKALIPFLHLAVVYEYESVTKMFLEEGTDVNAAITDHGGATPLLVAVQRYNSGRVVPLLLKHGADIFAKDRFGKNVLHYLACSIVEQANLARTFIEKGISINDRCDRYRNQPIHLAALNGRNALVNLFLDHGADVHSRSATQDDDDLFPLYLAAECNNPEVIETLLKRGAIIGMKTKNGRTALHNACKARRLENIKLLLSAGADVLIQDCESITPFSLLTRTFIRNYNRDSKPIVRIMIKALVLKKLCQPSIELEDEKIMRKIPKVWNCYQDCIAQICRMKATSFVENCTFFDLITKSHQQIAGFMRNPDFEANFQLYDLMSEFPRYAEEMRETFERAQSRCHSILKYENVINEAFYYIMPDVVVRNIARCLVDRFEK